MRTSYALSYSSARVPDTKGLVLRHSGKGSRGGDDRKFSTSASRVLERMDGITLEECAAAADQRATAAAFSYLISSGRCFLLKSAATKLTTSYVVSYQKVING